MAVGLRLAIVVAYDSGHEVAIPALESRDVAVQSEIFAMLVMGAVTYAMTDVMEEGAGFQLNAGLRGKMVNGLKLIKKHKAEFADMVGVLLIIFEPAAKASRGEEHLTRGGIVTMRLLAGESLARDLMEQAFSNANAGNDEAANVQITAQGDEDNGGDAHDVSTIATYAVGLHARAEIALEKLGEALAEKRQFKRGKAILPRPGRDVRKCFGVTTESDRNFIGEIGAMRKTRFEEGANIPANLFGLKGTDNAVDIESGEEANGSNGELRASKNGVVTENTEFEAASAEVNDAARLGFRAHGGDNRFTAKARFFLCADNFESNAGSAFDTTEKAFAVLRFAGGAGGDRAILGDAVFLHEFVEVAKRLHSFFQNVFAKTMANEDTLTKTKRIPFVDQNLDIKSGISTGNGQADRVGAGIDGGDMNRLGHEYP